jgi:methyltransferase (TIGR00027 family)
VRFRPRAVGWQAEGVTDREASSTAVLVCQGRAVADGRYAVGRFSDPVARQLLDPGERRVVDDVRSGPAPSGGARITYELVSRTGLTMVPRTIAIDDAIREHAAGQVVVLGAGLDGRAWRMPELAPATVFEVDHPASQRDKIRRLRDLAPTAGRVVPVAVDLSFERLAPALEAAGFDRAAVSTWVWEGVVPYLTPAEVSASLGQVAQLSAPGSRLVINYQGASVAVRVMRRVMRVVMRLSGAADPLAGEPWRSLWRPEQLRILLRGQGFETIRDDDLLTLAGGLDLPGGNEGSLRNGRVAVAVRR